MVPIKEYVEKKKVELRLLTWDTALKAVIVQVGDVEASNRYVRNKIKDLNECGIETDLIKFSEDITEATPICALN